MLLVRFRLWHAAVVLVACLLVVALFPLGFVRQEHGCPEDPMCFGPRGTWWTVGGVRAETFGWSAAIAILAGLVLGLGARALLRGHPARDWAPWVVGFASAGFLLALFYAAELRWENSIVY